MAYNTKTVAIGKDWTLVTDKVAMLQFSDRMHVSITSGSVPTEATGFTMEAGEKYVNGSDGVHVWAKSILGGTNIELVRVAGDGV